MKSIFRNILLASVAVFAFSCNESEDLVTANALEGGLVEATSANLFYVVGNTGPYGMEFKLNQRSDIYVESIALYKTFVGSDVLQDVDGNDSLAPYTTNEVLHSTINITEKTNHYVTDSVTFDELIAGLTRSDNGAELPASDGDLQIGDSWTMTPVFTLSDGREVSPDYKINFSVSTQFAGSYEIVDIQYYRLGVYRDDQHGFFLGSTVDVTSVDATTYFIGELWPDWITGNQLYFTIDPADNSISYPLEYKGAAQLLNDEPLITCESSPNDLANVPCGSSNFAVADPGGADVLDMTYGYFTGGSGPREFYVKMVKR